LHFVSKISRVVTLCKRTNPTKLISIQNRIGHTCPRTHSVNTRNASKRAREDIWEKGGISPLSVYPALGDGTMISDSRRKLKPVINNWWLELWQ